MTAEEERLEVMDRCTMHMVVPGVDTAKVAVPQNIALRNGDFPSSIDTCVRYHARSD